MISWQNHGVHPIVTCNHSSVFCFVPIQTNCREHICDQFNGNQFCCSCILWEPSCNEIHILWKIAYHNNMRQSLKENYFPWPMFGGPKEYASWLLMKISILENLYDQRKWYHQGSNGFSMPYLKPSIVLVIFKALLLGLLANVHVGFWMT